MNCAILILMLILVWCAALVAADLWAGKRNRELEGKQHKIAELQAAFAAVDSPCKGCAGFKPDGNGGCSGCNT